MFYYHFFLLDFRVSYIINNLYVTCLGVFNFLSMKVSNRKYNKLLVNIGLTIERARDNAIKAINRELVKSNWEIGRHIVEYEQDGNERAE
jgi:hypothetical protein